MHSEAAFAALCGDGASPIPVSIRRDAPTVIASTTAATATPTARYT
jgi:hypothetical protein